MIEDAEYKWLQKQDRCAGVVWEWVLFDANKRSDPQVRELTDLQLEIVSDSLSIESPTFSKILQSLRVVGWITKDGKIRGWEKWQSPKTEETAKLEAARKQVEYRDNIINELRAKLGESPKVSDHSQESPKSAPRAEKRREEESTEEIAPPGPPAEVSDGGHRPPLQEPVVPTLEEVRTWAIGPSGVDPVWAEERWRYTSEVHGWVKNGRLIDWKSRFKRYWEECREAWLRRGKNGVTTATKEDLQAEFDRLDTALQIARDEKPPDVAKCRALKAQRNAVRERLEGGK